MTGVLVLTIVALSVIYLLWLGGGWRKAAVVLVGLGLAAVPLALVATMVTTARAEDECYDGPCSEHAPLFLGAYFVAALAAVAVAIAVAALIARAVRSARSYG